jgi:hypothetical protein
MKSWILPAACLPILLSLLIGACGSASSSSSSSGGTGGGQQGAGPDISLSGASHVSIGATTEADFLVVADFNADGKPDPIILGSTTTDEIDVLRNTTVTGTVAPAFASQYESTTNAPSCAVVADFNGDGRPDVAVVDPTAEKVEVLMNDTVSWTTISAFTLTVVPTTTDTVGTGAHAITTGDFNGDGKPDLAISSGTDARVYFLRNTTAAGSLTAAFAYDPSLAVGGTPRDIAVLDANADAKPDLAVARSDGTIEFLVNEYLPGTSSAITMLPSVYTVSAGASASALTARDLNADGLVDLLAGSTLGTSVVLLRNATTIRSNRDALLFELDDTLTVPSGVEHVALGDLNADGKTDLVVSNGNATDPAVYLFRNQASPGGDLSFATPTFVSTDPAGKPVASAIADLNGDWRPDLVVANYSTGVGRTVSVFLNTLVLTADAPAFNTGGTPQLGDVGSLPSAIAAGDLNYDGYPDLVASNEAEETIAVRVNTTSPGSSSTDFHIPFYKSTAVTGSGPTGVAVGDLNADWEPDVAAANKGNGTLSILMNKRPVPFTDSTTVDFDVSTPVANSSPAAVCIRDVDADGMPELIVVREANSVDIWPNATAVDATTYTGGTTLNITSNLDEPVAIAVGDLNADGLPDLAIVNYRDGQSNGTVAIYENTTTFGPVALGFTYIDIPAVGNHPTAVAIGDVNADGKPDLVVANSGNTGTQPNTVAVLLNATATAGNTPTFASAIFHAAGTNPVDVAIADLNGDCKPDIAVANGSANAFTILVNSTVPTDPAPSPTLTSYYYMSAGLITPSALTLRSLNGDGLLDVVVTNGGSNFATVLIK